MKIALVWPNITTVGSDPKYYNVQAFGLANGLSALGHRVTVICSKISQRTSISSKAFPQLEPCKSGEYDIVHLPTLGHKRYPVLLGLRRELRRISPDIVQCAEDISPSSLISLAYAKRTNVPFYIYQGVYRHPTSFHLLSKVLRGTVFAPIYKYSSGFLAKSADAANFLISCGAERERVFTVHVGFNSKNFKYVNSDLLYKITGFPRNKRIVVCVGSLISRKNHVAAIDAVEKLIIDYPCLSLAILGDGPEKHSLLERIRQKSLLDCVRIISAKIPNSEMHKIYSSSFLCLNPSTNEIFGMVVLEAMACSKPVLGSNLAGMKDIIVNGVNGFKFNPYNADEIASALKRILDDQRLYNKMCNEAFKRSREFTWERISRRFEAYYLKGLVT